MTTTQSDKEQPPLVDEGVAEGQDLDQQEGNEEVEEQELEKILLHNLCILPPLQKDTSTTKATTSSSIVKDAILLPSISPTEPVNAIRGALAEIRGYAHITNYRLILEDIEDDVHSSILEHSKEKGEEKSGIRTSTDHVKSTVNTNQGTNASQNGGGKKKKKKGSSNSNSSNNGSTAIVSTTSVVSPYTSDKAAIKVSSSILSLDKDPILDDDNNKNKNSHDNEEVVLNDFGDLSSYVDSEDLVSNMGLRMVLERYDAGLVKEHVIKTRFLLDGNAPCVLRVVGDEEEEEEEEAQPEEEGNDDNKGKPTEQDAKDDIQSAEMKLPDIPLEKPVSLNGRNLKDFFYLSCGEEERLKMLEGGAKTNFIDLQKNKNDNDGSSSTNDKNSDIDLVGKAENVALRWGELDDMCHIKCTISYGGFNPPPPHRRLLGDLAYLEVTFPGTNEEKVHITAIPAGFYVNCSTMSKFDPSPSKQPCFSHELLDCLLRKSNSLRHSWSDALRASLERSELASSNDSPVEALFRAVVKRDLNKTCDANSTPQQLIDSVTLRPSWLVHSSHKDDCKEESLNRYSIERSEEELNGAFGLEIGTGVARDWNEELQSAREMPNEVVGERIERARIVHKTLVDFADAAVAGAMAIFKGQISPMNPNETSRSHVFLHNNIFFSRAIDAGVDTFKISQGDMCARKSASRDAQSVGTLHRLDISGLNTLATVLIDYLGTRLVCQSIVPGILQGEKTHSILYGAVEATSPLAFDEEMHETLEKKLGKGLMIASRNIQRSPLSQERLDYIEERKTPPIAGLYYNKEDESEEKYEGDAVTPFFGPIEMKGIRGSDKRTYCLDITRLTPRDANWVPKVSGGTGHFDSEEKSENSLIPKTLDGDELIMAVLRPELIIHITHKKMREWIEGKRKRAAEKEANENGNDESTDKKADEKPKDSTSEDTDYMNSLRMNLNVFLPHMKGNEGLAPEDIELLKKDESLVREAANYLWDTILPRITQDIRSGSGNSIPVDGRSLTEFVHQRGVNCRYLGRLAEMALDEENKVKEEEQGVLLGNGKELKRHKMPHCWLELLECEMVARAAKHVLDRYLTENGCVSASQPGAEIASFLSALMIKSEESAAETENRVQQDGDEEDEQLAPATLNIIEDVSVKRGHKEIWADIANEVGRRFRYSLRLFNSKNDVMAKRSQFIPLLRRFCQKTGIRLKAKNYRVGGKGLVSSLVPYPIAVSDIVEVIPLVKHAASSGDEGFIACASGAAAASTSLHILLPEAKAAFDAAQVHLNEKQLQPALDLIQEATSLYQRVVESPFHNRVYKCLELTSIILFQAQELDLALANANKALAIAIQIGGFDSKEVLSSRTTLSHILLNVGSITSAVKQQRATMYLMELMAGPCYVELSNSYHKLGTIYHEVGSLINALRFYQEAFGRNNPDRVIEGMLSKHSASILAALGQYKPAFETERRTYEMFRLALGEDHELSKGSQVSMKNYMSLSVQQQKQLEEEKEIRNVENQKRVEEEAAVELGNKIVADEAAAVEKKKKKKKKSNKKKK